MTNDKNTPSNDSSIGFLWPKWLAKCRQNEGGDETLEEWVSRATNYPLVEIDDEGSVWVGQKDGDYYDGHWLNQTAINELMYTIERGV